ncbi:2-oxoglutarate dehydrogenase E1 component [Acidihalobacter yilgarnensis]|uniref:2-oxoglutarate dehydrogenase E1 component n=1 Tax=Acidihalobacter yilgarnensis TaxID=2819280 RepID=A0A1D8IJN9_9GAMM|nr:2-oxoglutarate dehydrogenase E1 component [Acidihalobacter yilgarnensis]AOU96656.1 2-oxoglutarate dehydrogenase E1 component [Acidihalobacter yilgarnensis]
MDDAQDPPPDSPSMQDEWASSLLYGSNADYLEALFETYLKSPDTIPPAWRQYFDALPRVNGHQTDIAHAPIRAQFTHGDRRPGWAHTRPGPSSVAKQLRVLQLINAYRFLGHRAAALDPLALGLGPRTDELKLSHYQLGEADLDTPFQAGSLVGVERAPLREILARLETTYCGAIGAEYMHISATAEKRWLQQRLEGAYGRPEPAAEQRLYLLQRLTAAEALEQHLHSRYVGQKRFSLEGGEGLIPLLDILIERAGGNGVREIVLGMAHRGRLNVLINIMGKAPSELFQEFEGKHHGRALAGDVKYHLGFSTDRITSGGPVHLALAFNPSHLEIVGPVVEGSVRARQDRRGDAEGRQVLPVIIHGDAAFAGQGVVMETLNMSQTRGFSTKGTVHIVVNNQIGFTTSTHADARSSYYCTDVAKMVNAPILHVNGDDPEAIAFVTELALDYRLHFHKDVVIDLVCYRRHGHNEADAPDVTQPMMYQRIHALPTTRARYAERLIGLGLLDEAQARTLTSDYRGQLEAGPVVVPNRIDSQALEYPYAVDWRRYLEADPNEDAPTNVPLDHLQALTEALQQLPEGFALHPRVAKIMDDRRKMAAGALAIDWGFAETLAYATLVDADYRVRLCGQDAARGTFFHRHAVLHNQLKRGVHVPLRHVRPGQGDFLVIDSLLSEEAVLAFEYGYATASPDALVIWEAQFGDFANGAQVVIDQFISAGEEKWARLTGLVLLLPHGYEGQGAEHSSARLERFLQLCANDNMQVCMPTTPAQMFHLLRRQMLRALRKPLIVMSPKSLLRHKLAVSSLDELAEGRFQEVIGEIDELPGRGVETVVFCTGKIYYDLLQRRRTEAREDIALIRIEQLYPFPEAEVKRVLRHYPQAKRFVWCQDEPRNQGAWPSLSWTLNQTIGMKRPLMECVARPASAAPAVGQFELHTRQQHELLEAVFNP